MSTARWKALTNISCSSSYPLTPPLLSVIPNDATQSNFASTASSSQTQDLSLETYIARMKEGQDKIYYNIADSYAAAKDSPLLEVFKKKGIEVLLLSDPVDYLLEPELTEFNGIHFQSVSRGVVDLGKLEDEQEKEEHQKAADEFKGLLERIKTALGDQVKEVRT